MPSHISPTPSDTDTTFIWYEKGQLVCRTGSSGDSNHTHFAQQIAEVGLGGSMRVLRATGLVVYKNAHTESRVLAAWIKDSWWEVNYPAASLCCTKKICEKRAARGGQRTLVGDSYTEQLA